MTDKLPRRIGGDGDGPAETPTERLLREAMGARASLVTADSLRPAAPPKSRIRRLRPVYAVTVPLGLAAAMALGVLTFHGEPVAHDQVPPPAATVTTSPSPTAEPTTSPSPTATATDTGTPTGEPETDVRPANGTLSSGPSATNTLPVGPASSYNLRGVKFKVPAGWKAVQLSASRVCVLSPGAPTDPQPGWTSAQCEPYGVLVVAYNSPDELDGGAWPTMADLGSESGWGHQPNCPVWGRPYVPANGYSSIGTPVRTRDIVAGKTIDKTQWQVTCQPGDTFTAQLWGLSSDQVFVVANGLKSDYQPALVSILDTLDVSGHQPPASATASGTDIGITVDGLVTGQQIPDDGSPTTFSVTFKNTGKTAYAQVTPHVVAESYGGSQPTVHGTLERQDGGVWTPVDLNRPGAGKPGTGGSFALAPGQSVTLKYRMKLTKEDGAGVMPVTAEALSIPADGPAVTVGQHTVPVRVTAK
ncbi:hypothetical protein BX285_1227 [Streptomyces sp. 1114.5]|uniref:hypothetical protein n=1 Tax=Streptomyces sp. 1114.5 TaxID=1938830 RepID=UPI000EAD21A0|nr:hypothetical protein [Streptomyces sp. 1114.5]RKT16872.1 hypothetical protein BX285_1227 [Streptomyces sp. 1114.5]